MQREAGDARSGDIGTGDERDAEAMGDADDFQEFGKCIAIILTILRRDRSDRFSVRCGHITHVWIGRELVGGHRQPSSKCRIKNGVVLYKNTEQPLGFSILAKMPNRCGQILILVRR